MLNNDDPANEQHPHLPLVSRRAEFFRNMLTDWDYKDIRNILVAIVFLTVPFWFVFFVKSVSRFVIQTSSLVSSRYTDYIYFTASGDISSITISVIFFAIASLPFLFSIAALSFISEKAKQGVANRFGISVSDKVFVIILSVCAFIYGSVAITSVYIPTILSVNFRRDMDALSVAMTDEERRSIISQWALMNGQADYMRINLNLRRLSEKYHIPLPHPIR